MLAVVRSLGRVRLFEPRGLQHARSGATFTPFALLTKRKIIESSVHQEGRFFNTNILSAALGPHCHAEFSLLVASRGSLSLLCADFSPQWHLGLWNSGSGPVGPRGCGVGALVLCVWALVVVVCMGFGVVVCGLWWLWCVWALVVMVCGLWWLWCGGFGGCVSGLWCCGLWGLVVMVCVGFGGCVWALVVVVCGLWWLWCVGFGVVVCGLWCCGVWALVVMVCVGFGVVVCVGFGIVVCGLWWLWCVGFSGCGVWALVVVVCEPSHWGTWALPPCDVWDLLGPGIELVSFALQDGFLTTGPSGSEAARLCPTLCDPVDCSTRLLCPWNSPGKNPGVGGHFLLQGVFLTRDGTQVSRIVGRRFTV